MDYSISRNHRKKALAISDALGVYEIEPDGGVFSLSLPKPQKVLTLPSDPDTRDRFAVALRSSLLFVRIYVYRFGENPHKTSPIRRVSKSTAMRWHSWGTHVWIGKTTIQERYVEPFRALAGRVIPPAIIRYSPDKMPALELPQLHFVEPQSPAWREIHRKVTFS